MHFRKSSFTHNGISTIYYSQGEGEPFIFLPGWGSTTKSYLPLLSIISEKHTVYILELPGFGNGKNPGKVWSFHQYADYVSAFINDLHVDKVILSGHSFGGGVSIYTSTKNAKIQKLILFERIRLYSYIF